MSSNVIARFLSVDVLYHIALSLECHLFSFPPFALSTPTFKTCVRRQRRQEKKGMIWRWDGVGARNVIDHCAYVNISGLTEGDGAAKFLV